MENNGNGMQWIAIIHAIAGGSWARHKYRAHAIINCANNFASDFGHIFDLSEKEVTAIVFPIQKEDEWEFDGALLTVNGKTTEVERELIALPKKRRRR